VILLDGTMSSLEPGQETSIGLIYKLLREETPAADLSLYYEAGIQWHSWRSMLDVVQGRGINEKIRRVYGALASRYRSGDRIFLFGYSRGAYAARSLAGVIDQVGLLRAEQATERNVRLAWRRYERDAPAPGDAVFRAKFCHERVPVEMIGVFDTVKALGLRVPVLWWVTGREQLFHSHHLGPSVRHGYHALALDETRIAFTPVLWEAGPAWPGMEVEQMWFRGLHGDIGGQLGGFEAARPLANIPLSWMLEKAQNCGLRLPPGWREKFHCDVNAPSVRTRHRGWRALYARRRRVVGRDQTEFIHRSAEPWVQTRQGPLGKRLSRVVR
jgi:uncharacterized protein (DUF2235 family)